MSPRVARGLKVGERVRLNAGQWLGVCGTVTAANSTCVTIKWDDFKAPNCTHPNDMSWIDRVPVGVR